MATTLTERNQEYVPKAWESVSCLFCGSHRGDTLETFGPQNRYSYIRCADCGLAYLNPRPRYDEEFVSTAYEVYTSTVDDIWKDGHLTLEGQKRYNVHLATLKEIESFCKPRQPKGRMLEIGCHTGLFCRVARDQGWDVTGVDISPTTIELARQVFGLNAHCGNWLDLDLQGPFDLIYCSHTIEHVPNPGEWLAGFRALLAPQGRLCLEVPNMESIDRKWKRTLKRAGLKKDRWASWRTPDHLYEPCERSFVKFVEKNGFHVLRACTYSRKKPIQSILDRFYHECLRVGSNLRLILERA